MEFKQAVITDRGRALMTKLLAGKITQFTKIAVSETKYNDNQLAGLTALSNIKSESPVSVSATNATNILATGGVNNVGLQVGYYVNTVGLYANDPDLGEILYSVVSAVDGKNSYIPPDTGVSQSGVTFKIQTEVAKADNVNMSVDPANVATQGDLDRMKKPFQAWANSSDGKTDFSKEKLVGNLAKNYVWSYYVNGIVKPNKIILNHKYVDNSSSAFSSIQVAKNSEFFRVFGRIKLNTNKPSNQQLGLSLRDISYNTVFNNFLPQLTIFNEWVYFDASVKNTNAQSFVIRTIPSTFSVDDTIEIEYMITESLTSKTYLPNKTEDRYSAFMKYTGLSNKDSNDYRDYTWVRSDEAQAINYEAWASDKNGTNLSRYYPKPNLVGGNASAFKDWYPTAGAESGKDNVATRVDGGILQQAGISATGTDSLNDYRQWQISSVKNEGADLLKVKANTTYTISVESRAVSQSWVGTFSTIDFRANYKDGSTKILSVAKVNLSKEWQVGTATFILTQDDITNVDYFRIVVNHIGQGTVQFRRMKMEENNLASMFIPNSRDTGVKAIDLVPAYRGISNVPSTDYLDYVWDKSEQYRDAELQQIKTAITAMGGTL